MSIQERGLKRMSFLVSEGGILVSFLGSNDIHITRKTSFLSMLLPIHLACKAYYRDDCLTSFHLSVKSMMSFIWLPS